MANYRPKSLDELNSFYDKSLSTQNTIKNSASAISSEAFPDEQVNSSQAIDDFFAEQADISTGNCEDLTEDIQKFIRDFGKPATAEDEIAIRRHPVPIKLRQTPDRPKSAKLSQEPAEAMQNSEAAYDTQPDAEAPSPRETKPEKTEFVITAEKNELFEEYMRIMSDEDDDAEYSKSRSRKRKKGKKGTDASESAPDGVAEVSVPTVIPDIEPDADEDDESFVSFAAENEQEPEKSEGKKPLSLTEDSDSPFASTEDEDDEEEKHPRKKTGLQLFLFLFLLLFITLIAALAVTAVQTVVKVNSGELFMDKYYVYTAEFTDRITDINEGDLLFVEGIPAEDNEVFAYNTPDGIAYAVQTFSGEPERTSGKNSTNDHITVLNTTIKGKVTRIYPSLGRAAAVISESFMTVIAGLLVFAVFIILLLIFAFRHTPSKGKASAKDNFSFDEEEDFDETSGDDFTFTRNK